MTDVKDMPEKLKVAAQYKWPKGAYFVAVYGDVSKCEVDFISDCDRPPMCDHEFSREEHAAARRQLGLDQPAVTEAEEEEWERMEKKTDTSDGSTASYYELPPNCTELQDLISYRNLNAQDGEIFRAIYRKGRASHSDALRDARKVLFYAKAEVERLEKYCIG